MTRDAFNHQIAEEAADWAVRLDSGTLDAGERTQLAAWLRTSPLHVSELLQSCALLSGIADVSASDTRSIDALLEKIAPEVVDLFGPPDANASGEAVIDMGDEEPGARRPFWSRFGAIAASLAALVALGLAIMLYGQSGASEPVMAYATRIGEQRSVVLEDGSVISMDAATSLQVALSDEARDIELLSGEALFAVAHDPTRPFRVYAAGTLVQAVGTKFVVKQRGPDVAVVVIEGKVLLNSGVQPGDAAKIDETALYLEPGQEVTASARSGFSAISAANIPQATSWRERELTFSNEALGVIVGEFNRYNRNKLEVGDADLAQARFSGIFDADDPESFVAFLEYSAAVQVDRLPDGRVVLRPAE